MAIDVNLTYRVDEHYLIEKELAGRLRAAPKQERRTLYTLLYDEMFQRVPGHPMLRDKLSTQKRLEAVSEHLNLIKPYLKKTGRFLEIGPGDCALVFRVAGIVKEALGIDVSNELTKNANCPTNFRLILSDGCSIPVDEGSIDFAFSNQLMEHLHPEDAVEQLTNLVRALAVDGAYMCITPNGLSGPHDVSRNFDYVAAGFHLKEYKTSELIQVFSAAGLKDLKLLLRIKGKYISLPNWIFTFGELAIAALPFDMRRRVCSRLPFRTMMNCIHIVGYKRR